MCEGASGDLVQMCSLGRDTRTRVCLFDVCCCVDVEKERAEGVGMLFRYQCRLKKAGFW